MAAIPGQSRASRAWLAVEKRDKMGRRYVGQNEIIISRGMFSAKEAERELQRAADSSTEKVVDMKVETYGKANPEMAGNPRRGTETTQWGFQAASWLPDSPRIAAIKARREESQD